MQLDDCLSCRFASVLKVIHCETACHEYFQFVFVCFCLLVYFDAYLDPKSKTDILNVCPIMLEVCAARWSAVFSL